MLTITVNGKARQVSSSEDTPLLYILRNDLDVNSPQFGCGMAQCGACSVLLDGKEIRSCVTPASMAAGKEVTTIEGLADRWAEQKGLTPAQAAKTLHPVQTAWIEQQTPLCGFCQSGMMIKATELLESNPNPSVDQIKDAFSNSAPSPRLCRCGSYIAIIDAVRFASTIMSKGGAQ